MRPWRSDRESIGSWIPSRRAYAEKDQDESKRASKRGVGKAAVIMDEKTRRGRVGSMARTREGEGERGIRGGEQRNGRARQGRAWRTQGPRAPARGNAEEWRANDRKQQRQTGRTIRAGAEWRVVESGAERRRVERAVGCGGDVALVVFYLLKTSSELGAGRIPQLES